MRINQVFCGLRRPFFVELALEMATRNSAPGSAADFFPLRGHFGLRVISKAQGSAELKAAAFLLPRKCTSKKSCFFLASCVCLCVVMPKPFALGITARD
jgi:hypothetical protein